MSLIISIIVIMLLLVLSIVLAGYFYFKKRYVLNFILAPSTDIRIMRQIRDEFEGQEEYLGSEC